MVLAGAERGWGRPSLMFFQLSGVLAVPVMSLALILFHLAGVHTAGGLLVLLLGVGYATLAGGRLNGLLAAAFALAFALWYQGILFQPYAAVPLDPERFAIFALALPFTVLALGHLRSRLDELLIVERQLRLESEQERERGRRIIESITDVFFALDRDWRYTYVNKQAENLVGRTRADLLGKTVWEAFPLLVGSIWDREYRRAIAEGAPVSFEAYYPPLGVWLETHAYPSVDGLTIYIRDITPERKAVEATKRRARQQALVAKLGLSALERGTITEVLNEAAAATAEGMGVEFAKVLQLQPGGRDLRLIAGVGWQPGAVGSALVPASGASQAGYTLARRDPVVVSDFARETRFTAPELLQDHAVASGASVTIGIGERTWGILGAHSRQSRTYSEDDIHFLQSVAHVLATSIERERVQEELRRVEEAAARSAAEARAQARDEVLAMVAHDLRSPLATIRATTQLLRRRCAPDAGILPQVALVERSTDRAARLLSDLLDVTRIEAGVLIPRLRPEVPEALMNSACEAIQAQLDEAGLHVEGETAAGLPRVRADRDRILQVLGNLLGNALKFTPPGGRIRTAVEPYNGAVRFSVTNTGVFPQSLVPHLFKRFWQARPQDQRGTGLGLAIARGIVEAHGGQIWADTNDGEVTFSFTLPTVAEESASLGAPGASTAAASPGA